MNAADEPCIFCDLSQHDVMSESRSAFSIRDRFPVRRLHSLILPKRHVADALEMMPDEIQDVFELARLERDRIMRDDCEVGGFNFGANIGRTAGQKIMHVHFHLIPRRPGEADVPPAR